MNKDGRVKLGDFGIARVLEDSMELCSAPSMNRLFPNIMQGKYEAISPRFSGDLAGLLA
jgi:hypothetical protein